MRWDSCEPLRVTAHLMTGVVTDRWLPLDGVLLYEFCRREYGAQAFTIPGGDAVDAPGPTLPIATVNGERWYYRCSWAQPQPWWAAEGKDYWNKRFDMGFVELVDFAGKRGRVLIEKGQFKSYHMPVFYYAASQIEWYCVGDMAAIADLLAPVTHIGKKRSQGWGRVTRWTVDPWPEDWSVRRDGILTRGIPAVDAGDFDPSNVKLWGYRPPYYRRDNQTLVVMP